MPVCEPDGLGKKQGVLGLHRLLFVALAAAFVLPITVSSGAEAAGTPTLVPVKSSFETSTRQLSRDIGLSVLLPDGHALWIYGDTGIWQKHGTTWNTDRFIPGNTAMLVKSVRGRVPTGSELPSGKPAKFVPDPRNLHLPDGSGRPCQKPEAAFATRWPTGAVLMPDQKHVLVTYGSVCVIKKKKAINISPQAWGYMLYNWRTKKIDKGPVDVIKPKLDGSPIPPDKIYGQPIVNAGKLTLYSSRCTVFFIDCTAGRVGAVTLPATVSGLSKAATSPLTQLLTEGAAGWTPLAISVGKYPDGYRLLETTSIAGKYRVFFSASPTGPWRLSRSGTLPGCPNGKKMCFALEGHPELSTPGMLYVSYKYPGTAGGHIVVSAIPS
jgi:hypothetical protein